MKQFIVVYEAFEGAMQFFGPFPSKESANKWLTDDYIECLNSYKENTGEEANAASYEDAAIVESYGEWHIAELEQAI